MVVHRYNRQNQIRRADGRHQRSGTDNTIAESWLSALVGGLVDTCSAAPFQFLNLHTPVAAREDAECVAAVAAAVAAVVAAMREEGAECVAVVAAVVAAMREGTECVAVVAAVVAEDKERAVAATLREHVQVAAHYVASVVRLVGGIDSVGDAGEAAVTRDGDVCDHALDLSVLFLAFHLPSARAKRVPQQRWRVR